MFYHLFIRGMMLFAVGLLGSAALAMDVHTGPIVLGEWNSSFSKGKEYAETYKVPMLLFWGNPGCGNCGMAQRYCALPAFVEWQTRRKLVMVFDEGGSAAKAFASNPSGAFPYMCVYWPKLDGTVTKNCFSGLSASFPVQKDADGGTLDWVGKMTASVDLYTADYQPTDFKGGSFKVGVSDGNRLEAIPGKTTYVDVPLERSFVDATEEAMATFSIVYPGGREPNAPVPLVEWAVGDRHKTVRVDIPGFVKVGDEIQLALLDEDGKPRAESKIFVVAKPSSPVLDPSWFAEDFQVGEWTLNYAAAMDAVSTKKAAMALVLFDGTLWCPYCKGMESSLLADEGFYSWAKEKNLALIQFDQGRASKPATAAGTLAPRLLTYEPDPNLAATNTVSGAGYRSRNMIDDTSAQAAIDLTTRFTAEWLAPGATAARMSQPSMLLVRDDKVVARFTAYHTADRVYETEENLGRLNDFLKLYDREDESSDYLATTKRVHAIGGAASEIDFQISDRMEYFQLSGLAAGRVDFTVKPSGVERDVKLSLYDGDTVIASGKNSLSAEISSEMLSHDLRLGLTAYSSTSVRFFTDEKYETTCFSAELTSMSVLVPEDCKVTVSPSGENVNMAVEQGVVYCLEGFTAESLALAFAPVEGASGRYTAKSTDTVELVKSGEAISYQRWRPGKIAFTISSVAVAESECTLPITVERKDGASGVVKVRVVATASNPDLTTRFDWKDAELEWADGESAAKTVELKIHDDWSYDGDLELDFALELVSGEEVALDDRGCKVTIEENDRNVAGKLAITGVEPDFARKMTVFATEGSTLKILVERENGAKGAASATLHPSAGTSGDIPLAWEDNDHQSVREVDVALPTLAQCPAGRLTIELSGKGATVDSQRRKLTVQLTALDAPQFEADRVEVPLMRYVTASASVPVVGLTGGKVSVAKLSGTLPAGLKVSYNTTSGALALSGVPSRAGEYEAVYQVKEVRSGKTVSGGTVTLAFSISDPALPAPGSEATYVFSGKTKTFTGVPVMDAERSRMIGLLTLTVPATGKASAKYQCAAGTISMSATAWNEVDAEGTLKTTLRSRDAEYSVSLSASPDGTAAASLWDPAWPGDTISVRFGRQSWSKAEPANAWKGVYTVACLAVERMSGTEDVTPTGAAILTLKLNSASALNTGKATFAGVLPNGVAISGSAALVADGLEGTAWLPVFTRSSTDAFSAPLAVVSGVAVKYAEGGDNPKIQRAIAPDASAGAFWTHVEPKLELGNFEVRYETYGSWYDAAQKFDAALMHTELLPSFLFGIATDELAPSGIYGEVGAVDAISVAANGNSLSGLSLDKTSGQVRGTVQLPFTDANGKMRKITATYRGVILPGWTGCGCTEGVVDIPFVQGACWFTDKLIYTEDWANCTESSAPKKQLTIRRGCSLSCRMASYAD